MVNINFVPDDYIQTNESRRTNLMYIVLLVVVMAALGGSFLTIKIRQRALSAKEKLTNTKLAQIEKTIEKFEHLQTKRKEMMKTALTTAELLEPVPRSVLLATLTNNLPPGTSLLRLNLIQKKQDTTNRASSSSRYNKAKTDKSKSSLSGSSPEKMLRTYISIEGLAPTDRQVATYIESLNISTLLDNVALVESKENKIEDDTFRRFKLKAMLASNVHLTKQDIEQIRARGKNVIRAF